MFGLKVKDPAPLIVPLIVRLFEPEIVRAELPPPKVTPPLSVTPAAVS